MSDKNRIVLLTRNRIKKKLEGLLVSNGYKIERQNSNFFHVIKDGVLIDRFVKLGNGTELSSYKKAVEKYLGYKF